MFHVMIDYGGGGGGEHELGGGPDPSAPLSMKP